MKSIYRFTLLFGLILALFGCKEETAPSLTFDGQRAFDEVAALVEISPRDAGTPGARQAAEHLLGRLESFKIASEIVTFKDMTPEGQKTFHNVVGRIPGKTSEWVILGSHFDTMPGIENFQGANDSGSSTGVLLELARLLQDTTPEVGIIFAFFDGEEGIAGYVHNDGLHGSRYMAHQLIKSGGHKQIKAMVLLDMVGDKDLHFSIPQNSSRYLTKEVLAAAHKVGHRSYFSIADKLAITDDHVPFLQAGIPAIDLIDFRFGSAPGLNDYWHTEADNLDHISVESLQIIGETTFQIIRQLALNPDSE